MKKLIAAAIAALSIAVGTFAVHAQDNKAGETKIATFAGGCFWCIESDFDKVPGVLKTVSGYTGGTTENPTYKSVTSGNSGHHEALQVTYDPRKVTYAQLLTVFWHSVDPTDGGGQFCDRGVSYETAVFVHDDEQRKLAAASKVMAMKDLGKKIATPVEAVGRFYPAEDYHQDYYTKNPLRYRYYRWNCGRNQRVKEVWGNKAYLGISGDAMKDKDG